MPPDEGDKYDGQDVDEEESERTREIIDTRASN